MPCSTWTPRCSGPALRTAQCGRHRDSSLPSSCPLHRKSTRAEASQPHLRAQYPVQTERGQYRKTRRRRIDLRDCSSRWFDHRRRAYCSCGRQRRSTEERHTPGSRGNRLGSTSSHLCCHKQGCRPSYTHTPPRCETVCQKTSCRACSNRLAAPELMQSERSGKSVGCLTH